MSDRVVELTREILSLPISDRISMAQELWESIHSDDVSELSDSELVRELNRRDSELSNGNDAGIPYAQAMARIDRAIG